MDSKQGKVKMTISLTVEDKARLHVLATSAGMTVSGLVSEWIRENARAEQLRAEIPGNPYATMFDLLKVARDFERAVEYGLVMSLSEYCDRFVHRDGDGSVIEDVGNCPCNPFVYLGDESAGIPGSDPWDIVVGPRNGYLRSRGADGESTVFVMLAREIDECGYPRLVVTDAGSGEGADDVLRMRLEYVSAIGDPRPGFEEVVPMSDEVCVNRGSGTRIRWKGFQHEQV